MKTFRSIPDRLNASRRVELNAGYDGTTLNVTLLVFALDSNGDQLAVERYRVGETIDEDDYLGVGNASTFNQLKGIIETIHTRANTEAAPPL